MPAHVLHLLFAEDAFRTALGADGTRLFARFGPATALGAQGPDIFYHNQRTMPSGLGYGKQLHRHGYGKAVASMAGYAVSKHGRNALFSPSGAYTLSFATHAVLDRITHPFIIYFSGWVDPKRPETGRLYLCHAFYERILDVLMLKRLRGKEIRTFDFTRRVDCGPGLPSELAEALLAGVCSALPGAKPTPVTLSRIINAYADTMNFYYFTNPTDRDLREAAKRLDLEGNGSRRRLALFHPWSVPSGIDFLNEAGREWRNPSYREEASTASFIDLYGAASEEAVRVLRVLAEVLTGKAPLMDAERAVGDVNLNDGKSTGRPAPSRVSDPLPLPELLDSLYRE